MSETNPFPINWDSERDRNLLGNLFPADNNAAFNNLSNNPNPPVYSSPFADTVWQTYSIEDLINYLNRNFPDDYQTSALVITVLQRKRTILPEAKIKTPLFSERNTEINPTILINPIFSIESKISIYNLYVITSRDGNGLRKYFDMTTVRDNELVFFIEENSEDVSDAVLLCKMGRSWKNYLMLSSRKKSRVNDTLGSVNRELNAFKKDFGLESEKFRTLINNGEVKGYPWLHTADHVGKVLYYTVGWANYSVCFVMVNTLDLVMEGLKSIKIPETGWLPQTGKPKSFLPALFKGPVLEGMSLTGEVIVVLINACEEALRSVDRFISDILKSESVVCAFVLKLTGKFLEKARLFIAGCINSIEEIKGIILRFINKNINIVNAFL